MWTGNIFLKCYELMNRFLKINEINKNMIMVVMTI